MSVQINTAFYNNLLSSVEAFLNTNVVTPYNTAVTGTNYNAPLRIIMRPQDEGTIAEVPAIVMPDIVHNQKSVDSTGMGDGSVWMYKTLEIEVYPGLITDTNGAQKSSVKSAAILQSLFDNISTALTIPFYDYTTNPNSPTLLGGMYADGTIHPMRGAIKTLALHRNRFDYRLNVRIDVYTLNG